MKLLTHKTGYLYVKLWDKNKNYGKRVHRLILETFIGSCPENMESCHNNGKRDDNRLSNLRWDTHSNNQQDSIEHNTFVFGERNGNSKLLNRDIIDIRKLIINNNSCVDIAKIYNVNYSTIRRIYSKKTWSHLV